MKCRLIHIIPFDLGSQSLPRRSARDSYSHDLLGTLQSQIKKKGYTVRDLHGSFFCAIELTERIECRLTNHGVGIFIVSEDVPEACELSDGQYAFPDSQACAIYYTKKQFQTKVQSSTRGFHQEAQNLLEEIWAIVNAETPPLRPHSANRLYKGNGLSYSLTIYDIKIENEEQDSAQLDLLMNPETMSSIANKESWKSLPAIAEKGVPGGARATKFDQNTYVLASWTAIAVVSSEKATPALNIVIDYEALLQTGWFLFDATVDNLEKSHFSGVQLQQLKNAVADMGLALSCRTSANTSTSIKQIVDSIYDTSGLEDVKSKCLLMLDSHLELEKAHSEERHRFYRIITEILLIAFTLLQIYEPVRDLANNQVSSNDAITLLLITFLFVISSIIIIKRER